VNQGSRHALGGSEPVEKKFCSFLFFSDFQKLLANAAPSFPVSVGGASDSVFWSG
jgi:hypothetical protein